MVRQTLSEILSSDQEIEIIERAADLAFIAAEMISEQIPDASLALDIEMPPNGWFNVFTENNVAAPRSGSDLFQFGGRRRAI